MSHKTHDDLVNDARNASKVIALIYSPIELHEYIVEIITKDSDVFIEKGMFNTKYRSVDQAISCAIENGAEEFFLCAENTYDECGTLDAAVRFNYMPLHSKHKRRTN